MTKPQPRVVAVANGTYAKLAKLDRAVPDATDLVQLLENLSGFASVTFNDRPLGQLVSELSTALDIQSQRDGVLVVLWIGHGKQGGKGQLQLMSQRDAASDDKVADADQLGEWAARTGAKKVLVVVDTCYSGAAVVNALDMANAVFSGQRDTSTTWFGVVSASRGDELAGSGVLPTELKRLLTEGPKDASLRLRWGSYGKFVRGDDVIDALLKEWSDPRQTPQQAATGSAWPMLYNPLHRAGARAHVVEHLLQAARGTSTDELFFTGREAELAQVVSWTNKKMPGSFVVTGPAGSGKSAILGRIASLSDAYERARIFSAETINPDTDPGEGSVSAQLHCRGMDTNAAIKNIASQLEIAMDDPSVYDILGHAKRRRNEQKPILILIDGLDEAGDAECRNIALEVVQPLTREALVLVGTRDVPGGKDEPGLLSLLGATAGTIALGSQQESTLLDVHRYVTRRLDGVSPTMAPEAVANEIVAAAREHDPAVDGPFLLARLVTSQLREAPVDTSTDAWKDGLARTVVTALEDDLECTVLTIDGKEHPTAARELLSALACACGAGFPADDVWPAVATAISPSRTTYARTEVYQLLEKLGRHVVAGAEGDQGVFRVAHQRLVDHLRPTIGSDVDRRLQPETALSIAETIATLYETLLDQGQTPRQHTYLWRYAWRHMADAGTRGIALLRRFVERDREAFVPDLAAALGRIGTASYLRASPQDAIALQQEAVDIRKEIGKPIPLALALFDLSFALGSTGQTQASDEVALEATELVRSMPEEPRGNEILGVTLQARALSQLRRGNERGSLRVAEEAVALIEPGIETNPDAVGALASALYLAAQAAHALADYSRADTYSARAVSLLDAQSDGAVNHDALMLDALVVRANVELAQLTEAFERRENGLLPAAEPPSASAAARVVELHRRHGVTSTIADITAAEGMRLLATTTFLEQHAGWAPPHSPEPTGLLEEALALTRPFINANNDALVTWALATVSHAQWSSTTNPEAAHNELLASEQLLRAAPRSSQIDTAFGLTLDLLIYFGISAGEDRATTIARQREAISLLSASKIPILRRQLLAPGYLRLLALLQAAGMQDGQTELREEGLLVLREIQDGSFIPASQLAEMLINLSLDYLRLGRFSEAVHSSDEALAVLRPFNDTDDRARVPRGVAELNRSAALIGLERADDARAGLERVLLLLDAEPLTSETVGYVGLANYNLSILDLNGGDFPAALPHSSRALELLEHQQDSVGATFVALARINKGRALRGSGRDAEGAPLLSQGLAELRAQATDPRSIAVLAQALDGAGEAVWEAVLADLEDEPALERDLLLYRRWPAERFREAIAVVQAALSDARNDMGRVRDLHSLARIHRRKDPARYDAEWRELEGSIPAWLPINSELDILLVAWWNTSSWDASRAYLEANPQLLSPDTDILFAELRDAGADADGLESHLRILHRARTDGVSTAYTPLFARRSLDAWKESNFSADFLSDHLEELQAPAVMSWIDEQRTAGEGWARYLHGILTLTRRGEQITAYRIAQDAVFGKAQLEMARGSGDAERVEAIEGVMGARADEEAVAE